MTWGLLWPGGQVVGCMTVTGDRGGDKGQRGGEARVQDFAHMVAQVGPVVQFVQKVAQRGRMCNELCKMSPVVQDFAQRGGGAAEGRNRN